MRSFKTTTTLILLLQLLLVAKADNSRLLRRAQRLQVIENDGKKYGKRIPASSFIEKKGGVIKGTTSKGIFWLNAGDWIVYQVDLPDAGKYFLEVRVSSPLGNGSFDVVNPNDTSEVYARFDNMPITKTWNEYATVNASLTLPKGPVPFMLQVLTEGWSLLWISLKEISDAEATAISDPTPILDTRAPGDADVNTTRNVTRGEDQIMAVRSYRTMIASSSYSEMEGMEVEESMEGLKNLCRTDRGDYATYNLQLPVGGVFLFKARISSPEGTGAFQIRNKNTGEIYASVTELPSTGDFQIWETLSTKIELPAGDLILEIRVLSKGWNLLWMVLELQPEQPAVIDVAAPVSFVNNGK